MNRTDTRPFRSTLRLVRALTTSLILTVGTSAIPHTIQACPIQTIPQSADTSDTTRARYDSVQKRLDRTIDEGKPIVIHVLVALCDNVHQGIVKVNERLGDGQNPTTNLYWGAAYGVQTYMTRNAGYTVLHRDTLNDRGILERLILHKRMRRSGRHVDVVLVADAWDGSTIQQTTWNFLVAASGQQPEEISVNLPGAPGPTTVEAGGGAALLAYVGHNGLMDFRFRRVPIADTTAPPRSALVLACASKPYFRNILLAGGAHPLLLTTHLMAPEAYSLDAAVRAFTVGAEPNELHEQVAAAYNRYQKCGLRGARNLFSFEP